MNNWWADLTVGEAIALNDAANRAEEKEIEKAQEEWEEWRNTFEQRQ